MKQGKSFRLSEETIKALEMLSRQWRVGQAEVIGILIHAASEIGWADEEKFDDLVALVRKL